MRRNIKGGRRRPAPIINNFLKFGGGLRAFLFAQVYLPAQVGLNEITGALIAADGLKDLKSLSAVPTPDFNRGLRQRYEDFNGKVSRVLPDYFIHQGLRLQGFAAQGMGDAYPPHRCWGTRVNRSASDVFMRLPAS